MCHHTVCVVVACTLCFTLSHTHTHTHAHTRTHTHTHTHTNTHTHTHRLLKLMREMFGPQNVNWSHEDQEKIEICVDSNKALLDPTTMVSELSKATLILSHKV